MGNCYEKVKSLELIPSCTDRIATSQRIAQKKNDDFGTVAIKRKILHNCEYVVKKKENNDNEEKSSLSISDEPSGNFMCVTCKDDVKDHRSHNRDKSPRTYDSGQAKKSISRTSLPKEADEMETSLQQLDILSQHNSFNDDILQIPSLGYNNKRIHRNSTVGFREYRQQQLNHCHFDVHPRKDLSSNSESEKEKERGVNELSINHLTTPRTSVMGRAASLPTSAALINDSDLSRLQGIYEKAKGKKGSNGSRASIGKSMLNRLTRKLIPTNDNDSKAQVVCKSSGDQASSPDRISNSSCTSEVAIEFTSPSSTPKNNRKLFDRSSSASSGTKHKRRPSPMGQKIKRTFTSGSDNLLQQAIANNDLDMLKKLLFDDRYLQEINHLEPPGVTIFHQACVYGHLRIVQLLISKGADVTLLTWTKLSPLKIAVMFGHYELAQLLLDSGADLNDIKNGF